MMKRFFFLLFATVGLGLFHSCRQDDNYFYLEGNIKGLNDSVVSLYGIFNDPDSIVELPVEQGKFSCSLPLDTITPLFLLLNGERWEYPIFADKGLHIQIEGDVANPDSMSIIGGVAQDEFTAFARSIRPLKNYFEIQLMADSFIVAHPHSIVSVYLIYKYFVNSPSSDKAQIESICKQLSGNMQDNPYISRLLSTMDAPGKRVSIQHLNIANLADTTGVIVKSNSYKENIVVLSLWASWHPESRIMQDSLQAHIKHFAKRPVKFVSVSLDSDREQWMNAIREDKLGGIHLCDFKGWNGAFVQTTGATGLPKVFVLNQSGRILISDVWGKRLENFVDKQLDQLEEQQAKLKKKKKRS